MGTDIRVPLGALFALLGGLMVIYGATSDPALYRKSLGINLNLWWGAVLLIAGLLTLWVSRASLKKSKP